MTGMTRRYKKVKSTGLQVSTTAVQWHFTDILFFVILDLNFN